MKKFDVHVKKVNKDPHSNIHQNFNVTVIKSTTNKEGHANKRKNTIKNVKLNEDMVPLKKKKKYKQKNLSKEECRRYLLYSLFYFKINF